MDSNVEERPKKEREESGRKEGRELQLQVKSSEKSDITTALKEIDTARNDGLTSRRQKLRMDFQ